MVGECEAFALGWLLEQQANDRKGIIRGYGPDGAEVNHGFGSQAEVDRFNRDAKLGWQYVLDVDPPPTDPYFMQHKPL